MEPSLASTHHPPASASHVPSCEDILFNPEQETRADGAAGAV
jgi:hypothetical protein